MMRDSSGSAIFILLILLACFAALSYAVSQSFRVESNNSVPKETLALAASDHMAFGESVRARFSTLTEINKIPETSLCFGTAAYKLFDGTTNFYNANTACASSACEVFIPDSPSGIIPVVFNKQLSTQAQAAAGNRPIKGGSQIAQWTIHNLGTTTPELIIYTRGVSPELCNYYNSLQGITTSFDDNTYMESFGESSSDLPGTFPWNGPIAFTSTGTFGDAAGIPAQFAGKMTFCAPIDHQAFAARLGIVHVLKVH